MSFFIFAYVYLEKTRKKKTFNAGLNKKRRKYILYVPRSSNRVEGGNDAWNVNGSPFGDVDFRYQNGQRENHTVKEESEHVGNDFSDKEEAVDHIELLV